jgi:transcription initiation factor TFIIIB Brf1 subunit/transcription initiation factor TFIIB
LVEENLLIDEESCDVVDHDHDHVHTSTCGCGLKSQVLAIKSSVEAIGKEQTIEKMVQAYMLQKKYDPRVND